MSGQDQTLPLVVIGGWGVDARMLQPVVAHWPGPIHYISLTDENLGGCESISGLSLSIIERHPEPAVWLGWSLGAQVVMAAARCASTTVRRVVTLAGFPRFVACEGWPCGMDPETFRGFCEGLEQNAALTWRRFLHLLVQGGPKTGIGQARRDLAPWLSDGPLASDECLKQGLKWLGVEDQRALWRELGVPALHLLGGADSLVTPWHQTLKPPSNADVRVVPEMTHWPRGPAADKCANVLAGFAAIAEAV